MSYLYTTSVHPRLVLCPERREPRLDIPVPQEVFDAMQTYLQEHQEAEVLTVVHWLYTSIFLPDLRHKQEAPTPTKAPQVVASTWDSFITIRNLSTDEEQAFLSAVLLEHAGDPDTLSQEELEQAYETWQWRRAGQD